MTTLVADRQSTDPWADVELGFGLGAPVAIGGRLTPERLLAGYHRALFCQSRTDAGEIETNRALYGPDVRAGDITVLPGDADPYSLLWWSPEVRYVMRVDEVCLGRTSRRTLRTSTWTTTVDADFDGVIAGCRGDREPCWITDELVAALRVLRNRGWVRTVEVWDGDRLVGGLFGCALDGVFVMDSAFHVEPEAAKAAIADLARRLAPGGTTLMDAQVKTDYTVRMGAHAMPRHEYLDCIGTSRASGALVGGTHAVRDLVPPAG
ncbi:MAG TPA: hypothetical protein VGM10_23455 [Actinocrinis sp.]|jgi:leucyl/phenylalanyl-tRNA--protein transferase